MPHYIGTQYTSPQNKTYTTSTVSNEEYIQNIHVTHGHVPAKPLRDMLIQQGKWQLPFRDIIDKVIKQCMSVHLSPLSLSSLSDYPFLFIPNPKSLTSSTLFPSL